MEWISIIDKRPDSSTDPVLMVIEGQVISGTIYPENYISDPYHLCMDSNGYWRPECTHWMPSPELPKNF